MSKERFQQYTALTNKIADIEKEIKFEKRFCVSTKRRFELIKEKANLKSELEKLENELVNYIDKL
jgi:hypothetical protein